MNKNIMIIVSLVLIGASFYGGMKYGESSAIGARGTRVGQFANVGEGGGRFFANVPGGGRGGGGFASGQILSKDANSITIQLMSTSTSASAGSAIVFLGASTTIMKTTTGTLSDLIKGQEVTVVGTKNADGSISANSIQLRPARQ